jgi:hypothetical protein
MVNVRICRSAESRRSDSSEVDIVLHDDQCFLWHYYEVLRLPWLAKPLLQQLYLHPSNMDGTDGRVAGQDTRLASFDREHLLSELRGFASELGTGPVSMDEHWDTIRTLLKHEDPEDAAEAAAVVAVRGWYHWLLSRTCAPHLPAAEDAKIRSAVGSISVCCYGLRLRSWVHGQAASTWHNTRNQVWGLRTVPWCDASCRPKYERR